MFPCEGPSHQSNGVKVRIALQSRVLKRGRHRDYSIVQFRGHSEARVNPWEGGQGGQVFVVVGSLMFVYMCTSVIILRV